MNRRDILKIAAASSAAGAFPGMQLALAQDGDIRFGCPVPLSGAFAANGKFADLGMKLAIEQYGKMLGRPLAYTAIDTEGNMIGLHSRK